MWDQRGAGLPASVGRAISPRSARCRSTRTSSSRTASIDERPGPGRAPRGIRQRRSRRAPGVVQSVQPASAGATRTRSYRSAVSLVRSRVERIRQCRAVQSVEQDVRRADRRRRHGVGLLNTPPVVSIDRDASTVPLPGVKPDCSVIPALAGGSADHVSVRAYVYQARTAYARGSMSNDETLSSWWPGRTTRPTGNTSPAALSRRRRRASDIVAEARKRNRAVAAAAVGEGVRQRAMRAVAERQCRLADARDADDPAAPSKLPPSETVDRQRCRRAR